jgi:aspartate/methionine/tyrosine aminotransferase
MSEILLCKPKLPPDWVDVSVGEPHLVKDNLIDIFQIKEEFKQINVSADDMTYPYPTGYQPLVRHLEDKHGAPVIITNGAKQALGAVFYALKKLGWNYCGEKSPHWALIPPLAKMHGIDMSHANGPHVDDKAPFLLLSPNNPDGHCESPEELLRLSKEFKEHNLPLIHDGAYYTHIYLPGTHTLPAIGDVQIFSMSKMLGLSGLRIGYAVCHNLEFYKLIQEYVEAMTVGVSIYSQAFLFDLLDRRMRSFPTLVQRFEGVSSLALEANKKLCLGIDPEILEVPANIAEVPGMFGWFKVGPKADFTKSKINIIDGALFGVPGMVRMNLAFSKDKMEDIVLRLNSVK